ncbi:IS4 family transposase [Simkania negevensis]|uniref:IS4 family transposase n=1 Tax=Simkania negevensis TaxID=83561 RepID=A0ABS3AQG2_9BACT|nr:IS4 family transposase [Simkania negevensis]
MNDGTLNNLSKTINGFFPEHLVEKLAMESGLVMRASSKFLPYAFLMVMIVHIPGHGGISLTGVCDLLQLYNCLRMTPQALSLRFSNPNTVRFLKKALSYLIENKTDLLREKLEVDGILSQFTDILTEDSTTCSLHEKVTNDYKGAGGSASTAAYKIHTIWSAKNLEFKSLNISPGNIPDQKVCENILGHLNFGDLVLRDLGYFSIPCFKKIEEQNAYFLSRFKGGVGVYTLDNEEIKDLGKYLDQKAKENRVVEVYVLIGAQDKFPVRLIAYPVSKQIYAERMRKKRRNTQKSKKTISNNSRSLAKYTILITNIPEEMVSAEEIGTLYSFRWQIELLFKTFKTRVNIHMIRGQSAERVECYIISYLISILAMTRIYSQLAIYSHNHLSRELSFDKFIAWILNNQYLMIMFFPENMNSKVVNMENLHIISLCKQKRYRKTSFEHLSLGTPFWKLYGEMQIIECEVFVA